MWLAARLDTFSPSLNDTYSVLCEDESLDGFGGICRETCGKCVDNVFDSDGSWVYEGETRDCLWLSLRTTVQDEVCDDASYGAAELCRESCSLFSLCVNYPETFVDFEGNDCSWYQDIRYDRCTRYGDIANGSNVTANEVSFEEDHVFQ